MTYFRRSTPPALAPFSSAGASAGSQESSPFAPRLFRLVLETRILFDGAGAVAGADAFAAEAEPDSAAAQAQQGEEQQNPLFHPDGSPIVLSDDDTRAAEVSGDDPAGEGLLAEGEANDDSPAAAAALGGDAEVLLEEGISGEAGAPDGQAGVLEGEEGGSGVAVLAEAGEPEGGEDEGAPLVVMSVEGDSGVLMGMGVGEAGSIQSVENTADDAVVTVGEDEEPTAVLQGWVVTGSGQISVTVGGGTKGLLTHVEAGGLTFTGTVAEVNVWLQGVRYRYSTTAQSQTGDNDTITLTFTPLDQAGQPGGPSIVATQDILVAPQNDAPVVGKNGQTIARVHEGGTLSFGAPESVGEGFVHALLGISDPDNLAEQVIIRLESIPDPVHGYLELTRGSQTMTLAAGSTFSVQELGNLRYVHTGVQVSPANGASTPLQSFSFTIDDGAGARLPNQTVSIELLPVNQAPGVAGGVVIIEGEPGPAGYGVSLGAGGMLPVIGGARGAIQGVDPDDSTLTYQIAGLPTYGTLYYNGVELTAENIASIDITDLDKLTYRYSDEHEPGVGSHGTHAAGEAGRDTFLIRVKDSGGGAGADAALESTPVEVRLTILENNDDPYFDMVLPAPDADGKITLATLDYETEKQEGSNTILITEDMLPLKDTDSFDVNLVFTITGSNADPVGYFTVDGKLLNVAEGKSASFTYQDVADGKVKYHFLSAGTEDRRVGRACRFVRAAGPLGRQRWRDHSLQRRSCRPDRGCDARERPSGFHCGWQDRGYRGPGCGRGRQDRRGDIHRRAAAVQCGRQRHRPRDHSRPGCCRFRGWPDHRRAEWLHSG